MAKNKIIPEDLVDEILWRLPVKSVLRFKRVSKSWYSSISSPRFVRSHLHIQSSTNSRLLLFHYRKTAGSKSALIQKLKLKHPDVSNYFTYSILSTCDGLIAFKFFDPNTFNQIPKCLVIICNPSVGESRQLPMPDLPIADDSYIWNLRFGIGYDLSNGDYKVVLLVHNRKRIHNVLSSSWSVVLVLTLKSDTQWRIIKISNHGHQLMNGLYGNSGIYLKGALHWGTYHTTQTCQKLFKLVAFNLADEKFFELPGLKIEQNYISCLHKISVYKDCICVNKYCRSKIDGSVESISLWIMKEYGNPTSWTYQRFNICSLHVQRNLVIPEFQTEFRIWFSRGNANSESKSDFVLHDLEERQVTNVQISKNLKLETFLFQETLVSPYLGNRPIDDEADCSYLEDFFSTCDAYTSIVL